MCALLVKLLVLMLSLCCVAIHIRASDPMIDGTGISLTGGDVIEMEFGTAQTIDAKVTVTVNTTVALIGTYGFIVNSSLLAPTVILNWPYNYTYSSTKLINTSCSVMGCGSAYSADWLVNTSLIPGGLKFYQMGGTYLTTSPHYFYENGTLRFLTHGNPSNINIYTGVSGIPIAVFANDSPVTEGSGWTYSETTHIVSVTHAGTTFSLVWAGFAGASSDYTPWVALAIILCFIGISFGTLIIPKDVRKKRV